MLTYGTITRKILAALNAIPDPVLWPVDRAAMRHVNTFTSFVQSASHPRLGDQWRDGETIGLTQGYLRNMVQDKVSTRPTRS